MSKDDQVRYVLYTTRYYGCRQYTSPPLLTLITNFLLYSQASAHNSPEADRSVDSQRSASTLHESQGSTQNSLPLHQGNGENDDLDEIFK